MIDLESPCAGDRAPDAPVGWVWRSNVNWCARRIDRTLVGVGYRTRAEAVAALARAHRRAEREAQR